MRPHLLARVLLLALAPIMANAQAVASGPTGTPLLWIWVAVVLALLAVMVALLFSGRRTRAHAADRARREIKGRT